MPAHPAAYERLTKKLNLAIRSRNRARDPHVIAELNRHIDRWLDEWITYQFMATEWDADQWGFDTDQWMRKERKRMSEHAMIKGRDGRWYTVRDGSAHV